MVENALFENTRWVYCARRDNAIAGKDPIEIYSGYKYYLLVTSDVICGILVEVRGNCTLIL